MRKYRIRAVRSDNGDKFFPEVRVLFRWKGVDLFVAGPSRIMSSEFNQAMSLEHAKMCIDYLVAKDNEREEIIDYP